MEKIHVYPAGDVIKHEHVGECECRPKIEKMKGGGIIIIHQEYGRERRTNEKDLTVEIERWRKEENMRLGSLPLIGKCFTDKEMSNIVPRSCSEDFEFALERALGVLQTKGLLRFTDTNPEEASIEENR